jgi:enamine deaminase RidA (YjgF/YER057c/UK114 family)
MTRSVALLILLCLPATVVAADVQRIRPGTNGSRAVVVGPAALAHTAQILPRGVDNRNAETQTANVLDRLDTVLREVGSNLDAVVKLNVYVARADAVAGVRGPIARRFKDVKPAMSLVLGALPQSDALVAMDAVAVAADVRAVKRTENVAVLQVGSHVYVSGQAEKGANPVEAARKTLESLRSTLKWLGLDDGHVVQVKAFLTPVTAAADVRKECERFFGADKVPPLVFVEWKSSLPIEIELVAASPVAKPKYADVVEYLTPPGMTRSPIYSRVARVHSDRAIYLSGLIAAKEGDGAEQVADVFAHAAKLLDETGSDFRHLTKATYYVSDDDASAKLNEFRPRYYDPYRPPAASKAMVPGVSEVKRSVTLDLIAVPSPMRREGKPEHGHGLTVEEAAAGWISLFDGTTTFGWTGGTAEAGQLARGSTTASLGNCELRADVVEGGTLTAGGKEHEVKSGMFKLPETGGRGPVKLGGVVVRSLVVRPLGLRSIFPGKDLAGWKRIDRANLPAEKRPVWKVSDGNLECVGGPGTLEHPEKYGDFIIQVQARSRNRHANGGLFLRAIPGNFMNGYEVQIHSRCHDGDPAKPFTYATGGIDDRQDARRLVSRDFEWFTMTAIADGPHLASWVNGVQVTDWTDTRPKDANPRRGLRTEPGVIQLQAHDPETDLEWRRIAVAALE